MEWDAEVEPADAMEGGRKARRVREESGGKASGEIGIRERAGGGRPGGHVRRAEGGG